MLVGDGPPDLPSLLPHFDRYVMGGDPYNALLSKRLRLYGLTRQSLRRCINQCDGTRLSAKDVALVSIFSRLYDSLCHYSGTGSWEECAAAVAPKFIALRCLLESSEVVAHRDVRRATRQLMESILAFPLLGRPKSLAASSCGFLDQIQCYWAKFPFSCCQLVLRDIVTRRSRASSSDLIAQVDHNYTFIGPAPRYLYSALMGDPESVVLHRQVLSDLCIIRNHFAESLGVDHTLYAVQINPCDWQHFIRARLGFPASSRIRLGMRAGAISPLASSRTNKSSLEETMIRWRFSVLRQNVLVLFSDHPPRLATVEDFKMHCKSFLNAFKGLLNAL